MASASPKICEPGGRGLVLPLIESEQHWHHIFRGLLYAVAMCYCFLGVSMIADLFMSAIEAITSRKRKLRLASGRVVTAYVWNNTVANLSLMALGSSAPEIFLSVIDLLRREMHAGDLGPSVIVGSAAFNLLVIVAVCIAAIPIGEAREIDQLPVFYITAAFSLFAYIWLVVILNINTVDVVDVEEAVATFLFMPALIWISYRVDIAGWKGLMPPCFRKKKKEEPKAAEQVAKEIQEVADETVCAPPIGVPRLTHGGTADLSNASSRSGSSRSGREVGTLKKRRSIAAYHNGAMASVTGRRRVSEISSDCRTSGSSMTSGLTTKTDTPSQTEIQFLVDRQCMCIGTSKVVTFVRTGDLSFNVIVTYTVHSMPYAQTLPPAIRIAARGHASQQQAKLPHGKEVQRAKVVFEIGESEKDVIVGRLHGCYKSCSDLVLRIDAVKTDGVAKKVSVGSLGTTYLYATGSKSPGLISFTSEAILIPGSTQRQFVDVVAMRHQGCVGEVSCNYSMEPFSAVEGYDYVSQEGVLVFPEGVTEQKIEIEIPARSLYRGVYQFLVLLKEATGGADFDKDDDGGEDAAVLTVTLDDLKEGAASCMRSVDKLINVGSLMAGFVEWKDQLASTIFCNGSLEEQREATLFDWIFHFLALPWKMCFAIVPPTAFCGGWVCFYISLLFIALVTAVIADLADLFGCVLDLPELVTAVTFVALGTSMPDLFASKVAAIEDENADASIVNVTGSNSVNVFLGLGLPWSMSSIYWTYFAERTADWEARYPKAASQMDGIAFIVDARNLGFSVIVFSVVCIAGLSLLVMRRKMLGAELGGPRHPKMATCTAFVCYWGGYVFLASWWAIRGEEAPKDEQGAVVGIVLLALVFVTIWPTASIVLHWREPGEGEDLKEEEQADELDDCLSKEPEQDCTGSQQVEEQLTDVFPDAKAEDVRLAAKPDAQSRQAPIGTGEVPEELLDTPNEPNASMVPTAVDFGRVGPKIAKRLPTSTIAKSMSEFEAAYETRCLTRHIEDSVRAE